MNQQIWDFRKALPSPSHCFENCSSSISSRQPVRISFHICRFLYIKSLYFPCSCLCFSYSLFPLPFMKRVKAKDSGRNRKLIRARIQFRYSSRAAVAARLVRKQISSMVCRKYAAAFSVSSCRSSFHSPPPLPLRRSISRKMYCFRTSSRSSHSMAGKTASSAAFSAAAATLCRKNTPIYPANRTGRISRFPAVRT